MGTRSVSVSVSFPKMEMMEEITENKSKKSKKRKRRKSSMPETDPELINAANDVENKRKKKKKKKSKDKSGDSDNISKENLVEIQKKLLEEAMANHEAMSKENNMPKSK